MISERSIFNENQCKSCVHGKVCVKRSVITSMSNALTSNDIYASTLRSINVYLECHDYISLYEFYKGDETLCKE